MVETSVIQCPKLNPLARSFIPAKEKSISVLSQLYSASCIRRERTANEMTSVKVFASEFVLAKNETYEHETYMEKSIPYKINMANEILSSKFLRNSLLRGKKSRRVKIGSKISKKDDSAEIDPFDNYYSPKMGLMLLILSYILSQISSYRPKFRFIASSPDVQNEKSNNEGRNISSNCGCPPMFGVIIPYDFFGNPFNLSSGCNKKSVHVCHYPEVVSDNSFKTSILKDARNSNNADGNSSNSVLQTYSMESDALQNLDAYCNQMVNIASSDVKEAEEENRAETKIPNPCKWGPWDATKVSKESQHIIDDKDHPLLEKNTARRETSKLQEGIETILHKGLSPKNDIVQPRTQIEKQEVLCNPPCSVWCDSSKLQKETLKHSENVGSKHDLIEHDRKFSTGSLLKKKSLLPKPLSRSLSVNDCPLSDTDKTVLVGLSRERLLFLRTDPVRYYKMLESGNFELDSSPVQSFQNPFLSWCQNETNPFQATYRPHTQSASSEMWGPFGGEGNLWQPLPECMPSNQGLRFNGYKRARDLRRQKSIT